MSFRKKTRLGVLISCSYTSPKLYARTLIENLPSDEYEITLIAHDEPGFVVPPHVRLIRLHDEAVSGFGNYETAPMSPLAPGRGVSPLHTRILRRVWQKIVPQGLKAIAGHIKEGRQLANRIRRLPIDLMHANQFGGNPDALAARLAGYKVVTTIHISTKADRFEKTPAFVAYIINLLTVISSSHVIAVSHAMARDWSRYTMGSRRRFSVVHHGLAYRDVGVPVERQELPAIRFGTAAMLHPKKGQQYLLEAFNKLAAKYQHVELYLAGGGVDEGRLVALARSFPCFGRIHFLGYVEDMDAFYRKMNVFVLPSLTEPFGYVLIEAMTRSLPVIASNVEAIPESVLDGETGLLVPPADSESLCRAMERLVGSEGLRQQLGARGRQRVLEHFTVESMIAGTVRAYRRISGFES